MVRFLHMVLGSAQQGGASFFDALPIGQAVLLVLGLLWWREILQRFREDLTQLLRPSQGSDRGVVVFLWALTLGIGVFMALFVLSIAAGLWRAL